MTGIASVENWWNGHPNGGLLGTRQSLWKPLQKSLPMERGTSFRVNHWDYRRSNAPRSGQFTRIAEISSGVGEHDLPCLAS
jgi:hypothetical protein